LSFIFFFLFFVIYVFLSFFFSVLGSNHYKVGMCLNNLGDVYRRMDNYETAEPLYTKSAKLIEERQEKKTLK